MREDMGDRVALRQRDEYQVIQEMFPDGEGTSFPMYHRFGTCDGSTIYGIFQHDEYWIRQFGLDRSSFVLDIGSYIGGLAVLASRRFGCKVAAVEPLPENVQLVEMNVEINDVGSLVTVHHGAVCGRPREEPVEVAYNHMNDESGWIHRFVGGRECTEPIWPHPQVEGFWLEKLLDLHEFPVVDFMKIDCEGAEWEFLLHAPKSVLNRVKVISGEFHPCHVDGTTLYPDDVPNIFSGLFTDVTPEGGNSDVHLLVNKQLM